MVVCMVIFLFLLVFWSCLLGMEDGGWRMEMVLCRGVGVTWSCAICGVDWSGVDLEAEPSISVQIR